MYCRTCGQHIKLSGGALVPAKRRGLWGLGKAVQAPRSPLPLTRPAGVAVALWLAGSSATEGNLVAQRGGHPENNHGPPVPLPRREVLCFDCKAVSKASAKATSTQCSNCGTFIDLRDVDIRVRSTQRIRTRGNVTVHKKGALLGTAFHCGSLVIEGSVAGSIYAQETVEFRTHAKVSGEIRCRHLLVEKRCHVQCIQPVHVQTLTLQGQLTARVLASGLVQIGRQGRLEGTLNAGRLSVEAGGLVDGAVMIAGRLPDAGS